MISIPAFVSVYVIHDPVSFACGIDGMRGICVRILKKDPVDSGYFLFVNKSRKQVRAIWYDGQGFVLATKRLSLGKFDKWPMSGESVFSVVEHFQAQGLLNGGFHLEKMFHPVWKKPEKT